MISDGCGGTGSPWIQEDNEAPSEDGGVRESVMNLVGTFSSFDMPALVCAALELTDKIDLHFYDDSDLKLVDNNGKCIGTREYIDNVRSANDYLEAISIQFGVEFDGSFNRCVEVSPRVREVWNAIIADEKASNYLRGVLNKCLNITDKQSDYLIGCINEGHGTVITIHCNHLKDFLRKVDMLRQFFEVIDMNTLTLGR